MTALQHSLRILAVSELWQGGNSYAFVRAFRRAGHSVSVIDSASYLPTGWQRRALRALRRAIDPVLVAEYSRALIAEAKHLRPHLFFVFKGPYVTVEAMNAIKALGAVTINFYPDVSVVTHGKYIPQSLQLYDWVFTTKTFGLADMERLLGVRNASFLPHAFDPEVHRPFSLDKSDLERYAADVSFIGTWSPKKERFLQHLFDSLPHVRLRIWGAQWEKASTRLQNAIQQQAVLGTEYAKCIRASRINLGLLSEVRTGASSGDLITSRTFHIPASGGFMLHERSEEVIRYFDEERECSLFSGPEELVARIVYYLADDEKRKSVAEAGYQRSLTSGYSIDTRAEQVLTKYRELAMKEDPVSH
jgi:glycosyltransferase involved in cell wall biosynthesis